MSVWLGKHLLAEDIVERSSTIRGLLKDCPKEKVLIDWFFIIEEKDEEAVIKLLSDKISGVTELMLAEALKLASFLNLPDDHILDEIKSQNIKVLFEALKRVDIPIWDLKKIFKVLDYQREVADAFCNILHPELERREAFAKIYSTVDPEKTFLSYHSERFLGQIGKNPLKTSLKKILITECLGEPVAQIAPFQGEIYYLDENGHINSLSEGSDRDITFRKIFKSNYNILLEDVDGCIWKFDGKIFQEMESLNGLKLQGVWADLILLENERGENIFWIQNFLWPLVGKKFLNIIADDLKSVKILSINILNDKFFIKYKKEQIVFNELYYIDMNLLKTVTGQILNLKILLLKAATDQIQNLTILNNLSIAMKFMSPDDEIIKIREKDGTTLVLTRQGRFFVIYKEEIRLFENRIMVDMDFDDQGNFWCIWL